MKRLLTGIILLVSAVSMFAQTPDALKVKTFTLSNGMTVWINEDHSQPKAFGAVVVKAGAKDCPETGIAHYFEHMMFKGTEKIGTIDYEAEKVYLDQIEAKYDELALAKDDKEREDIQMEINRLSIKAADYAIPSEFDALITACGGSGLNAYTSYDVTVYHNEFVSSFFEQWAELNSERIIDPVFRLFQSELETVYEEKNRSDNSELSAFSQLITEKGFEGTQYQYPIIGTTKNLKNPQLSKMRAFFDKFYVAGNMGLMLTGDIYPDDALPILEKTFGRIRQGNPEKDAVPAMKPFNGREEVEALVKIPIIKLSALCYRGPSMKDKDYIPMSFVSFLLNNDAGTGMLDKLMVDHKITAAMCMYPSTAFSEAGLFPFLIVPKIIGQSSKSAEKKVMAEINKLKTGDFDEDYLECCKMSYKRELISDMEGGSGRMSLMIDAFANGQSWDDIVAQSEMIDNITKADIVALANKYFDDNYLVIKKKFGDPEQDNLKKPGYEKIIPKNNGVDSEYAAALKAEAAKVELPRPVVDFEADAKMTKPSELVNVYSVKNELNDVFELTIRYPIGSFEMPVLERVSTYLTTLGTENMEYDEHRMALQKMGSALSFGGNSVSFSINVSGFDEHFDETMALVADIMYNPKGNKKQLSVVKENEMTEKLLDQRTASTIADAMVEYASFGDKSIYLADKGKINDDVLLGAFDKLQQYECDILYSGTLEHDALVASLERNLNLKKSVLQHPYSYSRNNSFTDKPTVYFVNKKKAIQSEIYSIVPGNIMSTSRERNIASLAGEYFGGGGLGSVLFQEIREFRSMAYSTGASYTKPIYASKDNIPGYLYSYVGTQCDKTDEAMTVVDSLITNNVFNPEKTAATIKASWFENINDYPYFRSIASYISRLKRQGFNSDPDAEWYNVLEELNSDDLQEFWNKNVLSHKPIWIVVGDEKKLDKEALGKFGEVKEFKAGNLFK